jgi:integrase
MPKLTKRTVDATKPAAADVVIWDDELRGFGLRVKPSGVKSYIVQYRTAEGRSRRLTLGRHGELTPDAARGLAADTLGMVRKGGDPTADRRAIRTAPTVGEMLDRYLTEHVKRRNKASTAEDVDRLVKLHIRPRLGKMKVASVTRQDVAKMHGAMAATPRRANHALAIASKAFNLAEVWGMRPEGSNPCRRIERYAEPARERFLTDDELRRLGDTLRQAEREGLPWRRPRGRRASKHDRKPENRRTVYSWQITAAIRLLLYTGSRLGEIIRLRWSQVDAKAGTITLAETKAGEPQVIALSTAALAELAALPRIDGSPWVLPMQSDRQRHLPKETLEQAWQRIRAAADLADVRLHDLRHTVGTFAGQVGANAFMVRDLLRHKTLAVTGRYVNRAEDPVRALGDRVAGRIAAALAGEPAAEVVPLAPAEAKG